MKKANALALTTVVVALLFSLQFILPEYHHLMLTRIMLLGIFALGFNLLFGYTGLLSLGHAMFFSVGLYSAGLTAYYFQWDALQALAAGLVIGALFSFVIGLIVLRTKGITFMIVTLMFSQVAHLITTYFTRYTRGEEGLVIPDSGRQIEIGNYIINFTDPVARYNFALLLLAITLFVITIVITGKLGRSLVAIRENENRTMMLGCNTFLIKLIAFTLSGTISAIAGATYALMFAYIGASFAGIQYSIDPLLYTLLGGAGTLLGPLLGTGFMFYLVDISSNYTSAYLLVSGIALILLIVFFPMGIIGSIKRYRPNWLSK